MCPNVQLFTVLLWKSLAHNKWMNVQSQHLATFLSQGPRA